MDLYGNDPNSQADAPPPPPPPPPATFAKPGGARHRLATIAVTSGLLGGGLVGGYMVANAATASPSATPAPSSSTTPNNGGQAPPGHGNFDPSKGGHTANGITETLLTGDTAAKVTAAAKAAVPGATILRVETDAEGSKYEAHMQKSDGTMVTVKVDDNFKVTSVENGPR